MLYENLWRKAKAEGRSWHGVAEETKTLGNGAELGARCVS